MSFSIVLAEWSGGVDTVCSDLVVVLRALAIVGAVYIVVWMIQLLYIEYSVI